MPDRPHPFTDIVIPVHGALPYLRHCVETVCQSTENYRIIFVDDFSDQETKDYLQAAIRDHKDWLLVTTGKQKWFTRASNLGLRLTRTPFTILLNSDCEVNFGWVADLYDVYNKFKLDHPEREAGLVGSILDEGRGVLYTESDVRERSYVTGHCYLLNMAVLQRMSELRGHPGWYFNEKDPGQIHINSDRIMCWEMNEQGFATLIAWHAKVGHHGGKSWGHNLGAVPQDNRIVD